ncbi:MAG: 30S ribosomal protein S16 [Verrucomicrobia bacterium]|nr:30S ribosomal protein S16 [Verrucomicrobiota bacterium]
MSVKIRLVRMGSKNQPFYRVVAIDSRKPTDGRYIERLGWYDPKLSGMNFQLKMEEVEKWLSDGAEASDTVMSLIRKQRLGPKPEKAEKPKAAATPTETVDAEPEVAEEEIVAQAEAETAGEEPVEDEEESEKESE